MSARQNRIRTLFVVCGEWSGEVNEAANGATCF